MTSKLSSQQTLFVLCRLRVSTLMIVGNISFNGSKSLYEHALFSMGAISIDPGRTTSLMAWRIFTLLVWTTWEHLVLSNDWNQNFWGIVWGNMQCVNNMWEWTLILIVPWLRKGIKLGGDPGFDCSFRIPLDKCLWGRFYLGRLFGNPQYFVWCNLRLLSRRCYKVCI